MQGNGLRFYHGIFALLILSIAPLGFAQNTVGTSNATGSAGGTATINWSFSPSDPAVLAGTTWCLTWGADLSLSDTTSCVANAPAGFNGAFTNCTAATQNCPTGLEMAFSSDTLDTLLPSVTNGGSIVFDIATNASAGDEIGVSASCISASSRTSDPTVVSCDDVSTLGGTVTVDTAVLNVQPPELAFSDQLVNSASDPLFFTISNDGSSGVDLSVTDLGLPADVFTRSGGNCPTTLPFTLADGNSCTVGAVFTPTVVNVPYAETITIGSNAGSVTNADVRLTGTGIPSDAVLGIDPPSFDFGQLDLLAPAQCTDFTISNEGGGDPLEIGTVTVSDLYSVTDNCDGEVLTQPGTCVVSVCFDPATVDTFIGTVTVTSNTPDVDNVTATVEGDGVEIPALTVNPDFGPVSIALGDTLGSVTNAGSADGTFSCDLTDTGGVTGAITVAPSLSGGITVPASDGTTDGSVDFTLSCDLAVGESSQANLVCTGDLAGTHNISCSAVPVVVPTMQNWGLILMALMMMLVGGLSIRFFRT